MTVTDNANNVAGQSDSADAAQAGQPGPASTDDNRPPASEPDDQHDDTDDQDDAEQDDDADDSTRSSREKRYRLRLREAERQIAQRDAQIAERDELLARTRQAIVSSVVVDDSGYTPRVAELVAANMDALLDDDGVPDPQKVVDTLGAVVTDYGFARTPRPPRPVLQQGHTNGGGAPGNSSWAGAIKGG
ncbi:hypothetical protein [Mycolicibacterium austroafricanum]|uniref:hypothetical protein n=1 Tax=Mycolicibacterium austroafricanum TaxID=39687 RepID=UPI001CA331AF|nr:hypothetical protein [Mycolicibacterium austroafricanum]QZT64455.1 hypothetical protein JN085_09075 [Mycolicibacterium austroafricanum]